MKALSLLTVLITYASLGSCDERELYGSWQCVEIRDAVSNSGPFKNVAEIDACGGVLEFGKFNRLISKDEGSAYRYESYYQYNKQGRHLRVGENEDYHVYRLTRDTLIIMDTILDGQLKFLDKRKKVYERIN
jgi:hypothetical protein